MSDEDGKSDVVGADKVGTDEVLEIEELDKDMECAQACPVNCIHLYKDDEKLI